MASNQMIMNQMQTLGFQHQSLMRTIVQNNPGGTIIIQQQEPNRQIFEQIPSLFNCCLGQNEDSAWKSGLFDCFEDLNLALLLLL